MFKHKILLTEEQIQRRVLEIADRLNLDYADRTLDIVCVLKGGIVFLSDLIRLLHIPVRIHFLRISSYGNETQNAGTLNLHFSYVADLENRHVLLLEDILDTGITMDYLLKHLTEQKPASMKICVLLDKPYRRKVDIRAEYVGFEIPDHFVIGYGLDYQELGRNLRYLAILDPSE